MLCCVHQLMNAVFAQLYCDINFDTSINFDHARAMVLIQKRQELAQHTFYFLTKFALMDHSVLK